ncbi:hypothetical protein F5884DRAFT_466128 [Xylogone sp. PMI_703]|nr:hypothetical protein F5884DRAFT_466128 [Xylogone sp. PMI_703]
MYQSGTITISLIGYCLSESRYPCRPAYSANSHRFHRVSQVEQAHRNLSMNKEIIISVLNRLGVIVTSSDYLQVSADYDTPSMQEVISHDLSMADAPMTNGASPAFPSTSHVPIAQLAPSISEPSSKSVKAVVTLTWPYSSVTGSVSFLLAEPDFRLRRTRGQVRVHFSGSSAKAVTDVGISSGDEIILCLDGVDWLKDDNPTSTPGRGIEFELKFNERLLLQLIGADSKEVRVIDIDNPHYEPQPQPQSVIEDGPEPEPQAESVLGASYRNGATSPREERPGDEWKSPAFIKRARESYGSLFDQGYDPFTEEDSVMRERRRKRTRLSSSWRYASRSPSPDTEESQEEPNMQASLQAPEEMPTPVRTPVMMDEGCQTIEVENEALSDDIPGNLHLEEPMNVESVRKGVEDGKSLDRDAESEAHTTNTRTTPHQTLPPDAESASVERNSAREQSETVGLEVDSPLLQTTGNQTSSPPLPKYTPPATAETEQGIVSNSINWHEQHEVSLESSGRQQNGLYPVALDDHEVGFTISEYRSFGGPDISLGDTSLLQQSSHATSEDRREHWQGAINEYQVTESTIPTEVTETYHDERVEMHMQDHYSEEQVEINASDDVARQEGSPMGISVGHTHNLDINTQNAEYPEPPISHNIPADTHPVTRQPPTTQSILMSRSLSDRSSQVVDLTESSGEEAGSEEELDREDHEADMQLGESNTISKSEQAQGNIQPIDRDLQSNRYDREQSNDEEENEELEEDYAEEEEDYYDEDGEGDEEELGEGVEEVDEIEEIEEEERKEGLFAPSDFRNDLSHQQEHEDDADYDESEGEEGYDEDDDALEDEEEWEGEEAYEGEEDEEQPTLDAIARNEPVVIDLLSSEDESDNDIPAKSVREATDGSMDDDEPDVSERAMSAEEERKDGGEEMEAQEEETREKEDEVHEMNEVTENRSMSDEQLDDADEASNNQGPRQAYEQHHTARLSSPIAGGARDDIDEALSEKANEEDTDMIDANSVPDESIQDASFSPILQKHADLESNLPIEDANDHSSPGLAEPFPAISQWDGSNDEAIREDETSKPDDTLQESSAEIYKKDNTQLPTPGNTQLSQSQEFQEDRLASQISFSETSIEGSPSIKIAEEITPKSNIEVNEQDLPDVSIEKQIDHADSTIDSDVQIGPEGSDAREAESHQVYIEPSSIDKPTAILEFKEELAEVIPSSNAPDGDAVTDPVTEPQNEEVEAEQLPDENTPIETPVKHTSATEDPKESTSELIVDEVTFTEADLQEATFRQLEFEQSHHSPQLDEADVEQNQKENLKEVVSNDNPLLNPSKEQHVEQEQQEQQEQQEHRDQEELKVTEDTIEVAEPVRSLPVTPIRNTRSRHTRQHSGRSDRSEPIILDKQVTPKGHDASVELAMSVLESPSKPQTGLSPDPMLKHKLARSLRTDLSEFTSLKMLRLHLNKKLDVLAIATTTPPEPQRAKGGPRQYQVTFNITDPSVGPGAVAQVQVFRPYKDALPVVQAGDGILLRNFQVISVKGRGFALRSEQNEASSWAVFKNDHDVETRGPPVEYGEMEKEHIAAMRVWYDNLDSVALAKLAKANADK